MNIKNKLFSIIGSYNIGTYSQTNLLTRYILISLRPGLMHTSTALNSGNSPDIFCGDQMNQMTVIFPPNEKKWTKRKSMFPPNEPIYILNKTIDKYLNNVIISSITYLLSCILVLLTLESNLYNNSPDIFCGDLMNQINQILVLFFTKWTKRSKWNKWTKWSKWNKWTKRSKWNKWTKYWNNVIISCIT